jgi:hypothetical protein
LGRHRGDHASRGVVSRAEQCSSTPRRRAL